MFSKSYVISNMHVSYCLQLSGSLSLKKSISRTPATSNSTLLTPDFKVVKNLNVHASVLIYAFCYMRGLVLSLMCAGKISSNFIIKVY